MSVPTYSARIHWSPEDDSFVAVCPELEEVSAFGDTPEEAAAQLREAVSLVLEDYCQEGAVPPPPAHVASFSGQFRLRLPTSLHARLAAEAEREGVSLNTWVVARLSERRSS